METNQQDITFNIVLFQPEIPANTGNIGRLCLGANATLHLIKPMRFIINDKYLQRAGLDYWEKVNVEIHDNLEELYKKNPHARFFYCTTKSKQLYTNVNYQKNDFFIFGPESRGIPEEILKQHWERTITIPMSRQIRSLNLANSVAVILYEALRQINWNQ
jgi:tRNA (cytidine/uridine-2'-O-)-methyltransferase